MEKTEKCGICQGTGLIQIAAMHNEEIIDGADYCPSCQGKGYLDEEDLAGKALDAKLDRADSYNDEKRLREHE